MPISTACPNCQATYNLVDELAGRTVLCRACKFPFVAAARREGRAAGVYAGLPVPEACLQPAAGLDPGPYRLPDPVVAGTGLKPLLTVFVGLLVLGMGLLGFILTRVISARRPARLPPAVTPMPPPPV